MNSFLKRVAVGSTMALAPLFAFADTTIDVTGATGALTAVGTAVAAIGVGMVAAISAGIAYRWVVAFLAK